MPCNLFTTFKVGYGSIRPFYSRRFSTASLTSFKSSQWKASTRPTRCRSSITTSAIQPNAAAHLTIPKTTPISNSPLQSATAAQVSRAACYAVHLSCRNPVGGIEDAVSIVNSLRYSSFGTTESTSQLVKSFEQVAIQFGRRVPSRLAAHALLHDLLRMKQKAQFSHLAILMMESGIKLRSKTLEALLAGLKPKGVTAPHAPITSPGPFNYMPNHSIQELIPLAKYNSSRLALQILSAAGRTRQRRSNGMFSTLICLCLINGEIILASLIFGFFVNENQLKVAIGNHLSSGVPLEATNRVLDADVDIKGYYNHLYAENLFPTRASMRDILSLVDKALALNSVPEEPSPSFRSALQALAYIANILDNQRLPISSIAPLLKSLYSCPRTDEEVWIVDKDGLPKRVQAYDYFHDVLLRLIGSLSTSKPEGKRADKNTRPKRTLDIHSYNALLHYTLRHRLLLEEAKGIVHHMLKIRDPPLQPDRVTMNILLRAGTLLRQNAIASDALHAISYCHHEDQIISENIHPSHTSSSGDSESFTSTANTSIREVEFQHGIFQPALQVDTYTLSTYITHLTSTGKPHMVPEIVLKHFPELKSVPLDARSTVTVEEFRQAYREKRDACLKRAVLYGPYPFVAMLNALHKSGNTGMAKSLFRLAMEAERKSWDSEFNPEAKPWCLPIHAYTIMLQCHMIEVKRPWNNPRNAKISLVDATEMSRKRAIAIYRLHKRMVKEYQKKINQGTSTDHLANIMIPFPDPRFFNAALDLYSKSRRARNGRQNMAHYRHNFKRAKSFYARTGNLSRHWHPHLREISRDIMKAGFGVPPALRSLFIGRWRSGTIHVNFPHILERRPFAYPVNTKLEDPLYIPTWKDRGLPLRRRRRRQTRFRANCID